MIVITGEPRSGTSLMMNIINSLGIEITGEKNPSRNRKIDKKKIERAEFLNPEGFWEVPKIVSSGITTKEDFEKYKDKTIKIVISGLVKTVKPVIDKIDKIIFCLRDPKEVIYSQSKLVSNIMVAGHDDWNFSTEKTKLNFDRYIKTVGHYLLASVKTDLWDKTLVVDYSDLMTDAEKEIKKISNFLGVIYNPETKNIIRKDLYRSYNKILKTDDLADNIYKSIKNKKFDDVLKPIEEYFKNQRIAKTLWLDDVEYKTWVVGGWDLHRSLISNNRNVRDKLVKSANKRSLPTECNYYNPTGEEYTIERVVELGPLIRTKINCKFKGEIRREQCFGCWQQRMINRSIKNPTLSETHSQHFVKSVL